MIVALVFAALFVAAQGFGGCPLAIDLAILQQGTSSWSTTDFTAFGSALAEGFDEFQVQHPDSRLGAAVFTDHPRLPNGLVGEPCGAPLGYFDSSSLTVKNNYRAIGVTDGGDEPQGQLMMLESGLNGLFNWNPSGSSAGGVSVVNIILLITDSSYHVEGDLQGAGVFANNEDGNIQCGDEDYPSLSMVTAAFDKRDAYLAALVRGLTVIPLYDDLIANTVGTERGHTEELVMADVKGSMLAALGAIADKYCASLETTSTVPIDLATTSTVPIDLATTSTVPIDLATSTSADVGACREDTALEIVYVQDVSHSKGDSFERVKSETSAAFRSVQADYPNMKIALATFSDKPIPPFGYEVSLDYCYWLHHPLTEDVSVFEMHLQGMILRSGNDWKEAVMDTIFQVATDPAVGFSPGLTDGAGRTVHRLIIVVTDAAPHLAGDGLGVGLTAHDGQQGLDCKGEDYPSLAQVGSALSSIGVGPTSVAFAVPPYLTAQYSTIALQWVGAGVPTQVYPHADAILAMEDAVGGAADPCGATGPARRLEDLTASLIRGVASSPMEAPNMAPQPPVEPALEQATRGSAPRFQAHGPIL